MKPTGWFQIGWSAELASGDVKPLEYFGQELVAFRSEGGELSVLDAHCRHLGAHLGHDGKTKEPSLFLENHNTTIGITAALFSGRNVDYRLLLTATPIHDERSDLRVSYFFRRHGDTGDSLPPDVAAFAAHTVDLFEEDARIWRHQAFVQKPIYALDDRAGYSALRRWCEQFYEAPEGQRAMSVVAESIPGSIDDAITAFSTNDTKEAI